MNRRAIATTCLDLAGVGLIVAGVAVIWWPASLLVAGAALIGVSWRLT